MYLDYGVNDAGELVYINAVPRGRLHGVFCPYCRRPLIARKGDIKAAHFAHDGETCRAASRDPDAIALPAYDRFNLSLSPKELDALRGFASSGSIERRYLDRLIESGFIQFNEWNGRGTYELTKIGKIPLGQLSLMLFNDVQDGLIRARHAALEAAAYAAMDTPDDETVLIDLRLFRAQWRRILSLTLYYLEITHAGGVLHKIGVTGRAIDERTAEIASDLRAAGFVDVSIKVIDTWAHRGNVELYFKHRYAAHQHQIGALTEYFAFPDPAAVLRDLRRMKVKNIDEIEGGILAGDPAPIERGTPPGQPLTFEQWKLMSAQAARGTSAHIIDDTSTSVIAVQIWQAEHDPPLIDRNYELHRGWRYWLTPYGGKYANRFELFYRQLYAAEYAEIDRQRVAALRAERHRVATRDGMQKAAQSGQHVGRPPLDDERTAQIRALLLAGDSLRTVAGKTGAAVNTIRKIRSTIEKGRGNDE